MKGVNKLFLWLFLIIWTSALILRLFFSKGEVLTFFSQFHSGELNLFFIITTRFAEELVYTIFALIFLFIRYRCSLAIAFTGIGVTIVAGVLKRLFAFERPFKYYQNLGLEETYARIEGIEPYVGLTSFPSGHTMAGFALMSLLSLYLRNPFLSVIFLLVAILVGISRIYLGHHFLEDVLFGSILGVFISYVVYFLMERWRLPTLDQSFLSSRKVKMNT
ncbi:phosphatase PAP2 family protein [Portibacter marinus]|uniref:phosphatase PAP2 family protein n=1 Tax=Portibacter marinus TaxID=2898660 RepID=UPI001F42C3AF|nr:phosphatase PAP2 family protein [Portibacter marinus]